MKLIGRMQGQETQVELKYCERCGGLWLRPQGADRVYCASCHERLGTRPNPGEAPAPKARRPKRRELRADLHGSARIDYLQGVAAIEVRA